MMKQWVQTKIIIKRNKNNVLDEIIDKSKSFEEQIKSLKKLKGLKGYWPYDDYGDKELKLKYFKIELADMSDEIDKQLFEEIFGQLTDKLINTTNKEENWITVKNINKNKEKLYEQDETGPFYGWVIKPNSQRIDLINAIKLILDFNETIQLDLV